MEIVLSSPFMLWERIISITYGKSWASLFSDLPNLYTTLYFTIDSLFPILFIFHICHMLFIDQVWSILPALELNGQGRATPKQAKWIKLDLCCFRRSNCTDCLSGPKDGCAWCTTLNKCVSLSEYSLDYSYGECLHFQAYPTHYQSQSTAISQYVLYCTIIS